MLFPPVTVTGRALQALSANGISLTLGGKPLGAVTSKVMLELKVFKYNWLEQGPHIDFKQVKQSVIALGRGKTPHELQYLGFHEVDLSRPFNNIQKENVEHWSKDLSEAFRHNFFDLPTAHRNEYSEKIDAFFVFAGFAKTNEEKNYVVKVLMDTMSIHDHSTAIHMQETAKWGVAIAKEMGLSDDEVWQIQIATLLHDIGKLGIRKEVLNKMGDLNAEEMFRLHDMHVLIGLDILKHISWFNKDMLKIVQYHHYLQGYPDNLDLKNIPFAAKIVAIADSYDAATGGRVYQAKKSPAEMIAEFESCKRRIGNVEVFVDYDQMVVAAFRKILQREALI